MTKQITLIVVQLAVLIAALRRNIVHRPAFVGITPHTARRIAHRFVFHRLNFLLNAIGNRLILLAISQDRELHHQNPGQYESYGFHSV